MSNTYDGAKFGVEKILISPTSITVSSAITTNYAFTFSEDITITEFGAYVSTVVSGLPSSATVVIKEGTVTLGTVTLTTGNANVIGNRVTASALTAGNIAATDTLIFCVSATVVGGGVVYPYIKYKARY